MQRARALKVKAEEVNTKVGEPCPIFHTLGLGSW